jgi:hypothetical protein
MLGAPEYLRSPPERASEAIRDAGSAPEEGSGLGPLRSAALRELLVPAALANVALTATEVGVRPAPSRPVASGPLLAGVSIGSILGICCSAPAARRPALTRPMNGRAAPAGFASSRPILALALVAVAAAAAAASAAVTAARHRLDLPGPDLPGRLP